MGVLIDRVALIICCTSLFIIGVDSAYEVVPAIIVVILSCIFHYFDSIKIKLVGIITFILLCLWLPYYVIFLPVLLYDFICTTYWYIELAVPLLLMLHRVEYSPMIVVFTLLFTLISFLLKDRTNKVMHLQGQYNELRDSSSSFSQVLQDKNRSILKNQDYEINLATLNERNRISKEIHDNIGHMLSRSILLVGALLTVAEEGTMKEGLMSLKESLSKGMDDIRNSIHNIYEESIDLYSQLETLIKEFKFCSINFEYDITTPLSIDMKHSVIAITKEAMANIIRHSSATSAGVIIREHPGMYQLIIYDNGMLNQSMQDKMKKNSENQYNNLGMGLRNMSDRVNSLGGNMNLILTHGFKIFITIPKT